MGALTKLNQVTTYNRDNAVLKAYSSEGALKHLPDAEVVQSLDRFISAAAIAAGHKNTFTDQFTLKETVKGVLTFLKLKKSGLRLGEVKIAISYGSYGMFGDFANINVKQINQWIEAYDTEMRRPAFERKPEEQIKGRSQEEIEEENNKLSRDGIIEVYNKSLEAKQNLFKDDFKNLAFYSYLERLNLIDVPLDQKKKIFEEERDKAVKTARSTDPRSESLREYLQTGSGSFKKKVQTRCKLRVFKDWINERLQMEIPIEDILN